VQAAGSGEKESAAQPPAAARFQDVYRAHFRLVWRALARAGVPEADRMDLTQNVFIIVHRQLPHFNGRSELTTWLWAICRFVARDYLRSARIRREVILDERDIARRIGEGDGMLTRPNTQDLSFLLESILSRIPEKLRVVFVMFEQDELSGDEIARLLNVPPGTVRSRLRLARELFKRNVKLLEPDDDASLYEGQLRRTGVP
jgi:RNA polymerase sigma-70 factor (ECF subfamily)